MTYLFIYLFVYLFIYIFDCEIKYVGTNESPNIQYISVQ